METRKVIVPELAAEEVYGQVMKDHGFIITENGKIKFYDQNSGLYVEGDLPFKYIVRQELNKILKTLEDFEKSSAVAMPILEDTTGKRVTIHDVKRFVKNMKARMRRNIIDDLKISFLEKIQNLGAFDADPSKLHVKNGVVDLKTGTLLEHSPDFMMTMTTGIEFDKSATSERWGSFIESITQGKKSLAEYLQVALGYAITGYISEQVAFFLIGNGANGKSVMLSVLSAILNDYAKTSPYRTFLTSNNSQTGNEFARLASARFVQVIETNRSEKLNEATFKAFTGGDKQCVRFLYNELFEYRPEGKLFFAVNSLPRVSSEYSIERRFKFIPFNATFKGDNANKNLEQELLEESAGIMSWLVEGALKWFKHGLDHYEPEIIRNFAEEMFEAMDPTAAFLKEKTTNDPNALIAKNTLYEAYSSWAKVIGNPVESKVKFGALIKTKGYLEYRRNSGRFWKGLTLKA